MLASLVAHLFVTLFCTLTPLVTAGHVATLSGAPV
jgi:hypothetical protein